MKLGKLYKKLNRTFPFEDQAEFDNSGLQIGSMQKEIKTVLLTLDITKAVIEEAIEKKADLIISHHPIIFFPLKKIDFDEYYGSLVAKLIQNDIAVVSLHTNYDANTSGMNFQLLDALNASNIEKHPNDPFMFVGDVNTDLDHFVSHVKSTFIRNNIRYAGIPNIKLKKVSVIGGSGGTYDAVDNVRHSDIDLLITADVKSAVARYAVETGVNILDVSHNVEEIFALNMYSLLENDGFNLVISKIDTDPFKFI